MDVIGIGCINLDLICSVADSREKTGILKLARYPGGSALNTISWLNFLGLDTAFIGAVGNDPWGAELISQIKSHGVKLFCRILDGNTGLALGIVSPGGKSKLYVYPGVNSRLRIRAGDLEILNSAELVHMEGLVTRSQLRMQAELARKLDSKLSFSPGMSCFHFPELVESIAMECDYLLVNHREAKMIDFDELSCITAITSPHGCKLISANESRYLRSRKIGVLDSIGAGDAFAAGFLAGMLNDLSLERAAKWGISLARKCLRRLGGSAFTESR